MSPLRSIDRRWFALFSLFSLFSLFAFTGDRFWLGSLAYLTFLLYLAPRRRPGTSWTGPEFERS